MRVVFALLSALLVMGLTGCNISKPYVMKVDRVDQKVDEGNRGYLKGTPPPPGDRGDLKRPFIALDIDLPEIDASRQASVHEEKKEENIK